jgi:hypothetical protein
LTHVQVECRGKAEDAKLELEFRRICDGKNAVGKMPNLDIRTRSTIRPDYSSPT